MTGAHRFKVKTNGEATLTVDGAATGDEVPLVAGHPVALELVARSDDPQMRLSAELRCAPPLASDAFDHAVAAARAADVAIVAVGLDNDWETEGRDRTSLDLPGRQVELIRAVAAVQPRTVVAVVAGSPVDLSWASSVPGLLWCWLPGQEGGRAIADVLFGDSDPGGRLPCTMPARLEDTPAFLDTPPDPGVLRYQEGTFAGHRWYDARGIEPAFPFGFGLSYASCTVGPPRVAAPTVEPGGMVEVDVEVTNTSDRAGSEVVQLYVGDPDASVRRPPRELRTFAKVHLAPGETRDVRLRLTMRDLAFWDPVTSAWVAEAGDFLALGGGVVAGAVRSDVGGADRALDGPGIGSDPSRVASTGCTRSSGSGTSPGPRGPTSRSSCGRRRRRWRPFATTRRGWWRPAGASSTGTPRRRRCGGSAPGC